MSTSIRARIRRSLLGLAMGLSLIFTCLCLLLLYVTEDQLFANQMNAERLLLNQLSLPELQTWQPTSRHMQLYLQREQLPLALQNVVSKEQGIYEYFDQKKAFFILYTNDLDAIHEYFLVYNVSSLLAVRSNRSVVALALGFGLLLVLTAAGLLALYLTRITLRPLSRLTDQLKPEANENLQAGFAAEFAGDEIGVLAYSLETALEKLRSSVQRELEFNQGVSHELRSPIQVAKNALELIDLNVPKQYPLSRPLQRLTRAVNQMEIITEAFLWLASERTTVDASIDPEPILRKVIAEQQHLLVDKPVQVIVETDPMIKYKMPEPVLSVVFGNLLRNAIEYTEQGHITCHLSANQITIQDTGIGLNQVSQHEQGFGIGLTIVDRICGRFGWNLKLSQVKAGGVCASIQVV